MNKKSGFTLVELLAVIVILAIILMIAVPSIAGIIRNSTKGAFKSDARMVLQAIEYKKLENRNFNPLEVTKENMSEMLNLSDDNYAQMNISNNDNTIGVLIVGKNKWAGFTAYGSMKTMNVVNTEDYDVIPPSITIIGDNPINIGKDSIYIDQGATAIDIIDGEIVIGSTIIRSESGEVVDEIDTSIFTTYTITYTATDNNGNTATSVRRVNVIDATGPIITINGDNPTTINRGTNYTDQGATAYDETDGNLTDEIVFTGTVNPSIVGTYTITYTVSDTTGNVTTLTRTIYVVDQNAPIITLLGYNPETVYLTGSYTDAGATAVDDVDGDLTNNIVSTGSVNPNVAGTYTITYNVIDTNGNNALAITRTIYVVSNVFVFDYNGGSQIFNVPVTGTYRIELWGAQGGNTKYNLDGTGADVIGGLGAYTSGNINLTKNTPIYIYVGGKGQNGGSLSGDDTLGGYNGGGNGMDGRTTEQNSGAGGGATDIRLTSGNWNDINSLRSRIMVAAAGGGASNWHNAASGGFGGTLVGGGGILNVGSVEHPLATGGTQTSGGIGGGSAAIGEPGSFGKGGNAYPTHGSGAGSGYYGGGATGYISSGLSSAAGGSSFISGYVGCDAINSSGTHTGQPNHYSGYVFTSSQMIAGNATMPKVSGGTEIGHVGNGFAKITYLP